MDSSRRCEGIIESREAFSGISIDNGQDDAGAASEGLCGSLTEIIGWSMQIATKFMSSEDVRGA